MIKKDIKNFALLELENVLTGIGQPVYRARQIFNWLYKKGVGRFSEMKNMPKELLEQLDGLYYIENLKPDNVISSRDGTKKFFLRLRDGNSIETVFIRAPRRNTLCISTQVGCKFKCPFCASGLMGFVRDFSASEMVNQILYLQHSLKYKITNYVFMGMGEPLDNLNNTSKAIMIMNNKEGLDIGARRITVSTCGVIPGINKLRDLGLEVNLSISLHASNNKLRDELAPINKIYPLEELIKACGKYIEKIGRLITLEYVLIKDKNVSPADADGLAAIAKKLNAKVNLIAYNRVPELGFSPPSSNQIASFMDRLEKKKVRVTLRRSKGSDIAAACGQLAGKRTLCV